MAATVGGALKALIEGLGLGISAYSRRAPAGEKLPYVTILDDVTAAADPWEDGQAQTAVESVQVDLWERLGAESPTILAGLVTGLNGAELGAIGTPAKRIYATALRHWQRVEDPELEQIRHIFDVDLHRQL